MSEAEADIERGRAFLERLRAGTRVGADNGDHDAFDAWDAIYMAMHSGLGVGEHRLAALGRVLREQGPGQGSA